MELSFTFRGKNFSIYADPSWEIIKLGKELQSLTQVAPHTMKLLVPQGPHVAIMPFSGEYSSLSLQECGLKEGKTIRMMGASTNELLEVSEASKKERIIGFEEEDRRAKQRLASINAKLSLPQGPYTFANFRTLQLPGVEMTPPPSKALELMHALASDRGIVAIMKKHKWSVGIMTEMAPEGLVGISPKCLLGFNKNRGEEISLRLRTDDLKGFRKYESIKKTLLHELAHMVHDEHDENFHQLDIQLNKEAIELDWTRKQGHILSGVKPETYIEDNNSYNVKGYKLGGKPSYANVKQAAVNAALSRFTHVAEPDPDDQESTEPDPDDRDIHVAEPDPDDGGVHVAEPDPADQEAHTAEPYPDDEQIQMMRRISATAAETTEMEPDPDDKLEVKHDLINEPDPDDNMELEPDPDDNGELKRIEDASAAANMRFQRLISQLKLQAGPNAAVVALQTLLRILSNVMEHPNEEKYRRLKKSNPVFQERVARFEVALELLKMVGFSEEAKEFYVLKHSDPGLLWLAKSSLETFALESH